MWNFFQTESAYRSTARQVQINLIQRNQWHFRIAVKTHCPTLQLSVGKASGVWICGMQMVVNSLLGLWMTCSSATVFLQIADLVCEWPTILQQMFRNVLEVALCQTLYIDFLFHVLNACFIFLQTLGSWKKTDLWMNWILL